MGSPVPLVYILGLIEIAEYEMNDSELHFWHLIKVPPMPLSLSPWGDCGGGFWVVARYGMQCLYYNDIEEGFNNSPVNADGIMTSYGCNQTSLLDFIRHVIIG